jgi:hypothetical protein
MKKLIISFLLWAFAFTAKTQSVYDSVRNVVEQYKGASNIIVPNIRQIVAAGLDSNQLHSVKPFYDYAVKALAQKNIYAFDTYEQLKLAYILGDYPFLLQYIGRLNNHSMPDYHQHTQTVSYNTYAADPDLLWVSIRKYLQQHFELIRKQVLENNSLQPEDAKMLCLYLRLYLYDAKNESFDAVRIEKEAKEFFGEHYEGRYAYLVQHGVLDEVTPTKLHFNFEMGLGPVFRGRQIKQYMPVSVGIQITTGINYKRSMLEFSFQASGSKLKKALPVKGETWNADSSMRLYGGSVTLGYLLVDNKRIALYPFSGVNMAWMSPEFDGPTQSKKTWLQSVPGFTAGMAMQYKWKKWGYSYSTRKGGDFYNYLGLRVAYVNRNFKSEQLTGNAWSCTFSFMGDFGERHLALPWSWLNGSKRGIYRR